MTKDVPMNGQANAPKGQQGVIENCLAMEQFKISEYLNIILSEISHV